MHMIIFVGSAPTKLGPRDRTKKIFLVGSPRVNGNFVGSCRPNLGSRDRTKQPLTPGDRTKNFFWSDRGIPIWDPEIGPKLKNDLVHDIFNLFFVGSLGLKRKLWSAKSVQV